MLQGDKLIGTLDVTPPDLDRMQYLILKRIGDSPSYRNAAEMLLSQGLAVMTLCVDSERKMEKALKKVVSDAATIKYVLNYYCSIDGYDRYASFTLGTIDGIEYSFGSYVDSVLRMLFSGSSVDDCVRMMMCPDDDDKDALNEFLDNEHITPRVLGPIGVLAITSTQDDIVACIRLTAELRLLWFKSTDDLPAICIFGDGTYTLDRMCDEYDMPRVASAYETYKADLN